MAPALLWPRGQKQEDRLVMLFPMEDLGSAGISTALGNVSLQETHHVEPPPLYPKSVFHISHLGHYTVSSRNNEIVA